MVSLQGAQTKKTSALLTRKRVVVSAAPYAEKGAVPAQPSPTVDRRLAANQGHRAECLQGLNGRTSLSVEKDSTRLD